MKELIVGLLVLQCRDGCICPLADKDQVTCSEMLVSYRASDSSLAMRILSAVDSFYHRASALYVLCVVDYHLHASGDVDDRGHEDPPGSDRGFDFDAFGDHVVSRIL